VRPIEEQKNPDRRGRHRFYFRQQNKTKHKFNLNGCQHKRSRSDVTKSQPRLRETITRIPTELHQSIDFQ